eukprot:CAMPEP_0197026602 /NCGR_PEP_ID=MMETSP1384-20130603/6661_1 /TAXON_ID=29189 /ORGANISM="Ammonia sp." /LENGTH=119 /DNA_ID=CAMNT_0042455301 /DNA_START=70 /DNA_END=429 /DNA_ORIENTATION=-
MSLSDDEEAAANANSKQSKYVKLISSDGFEFTLEKEIACASGFINSLIHSASKWEETQQPLTTLHLKNIKSDILEIIVKYFYFKHKYDKSEQDPPDFGATHIPPSKVVQLLMAAHYLDC